MKKKIKIINKSVNPLPEYQTPYSAGLDLRANINEVIIIKPGYHTLIPTGLHLELPKGYMAQITPRSGLALNHGITIINSHGIIDSDYRGDIGIILINHGYNPFVINPGDRIAQMVIIKFEQVEFELSDKLSDTERGEGGFGHTGKE